jgi:putative endonuclease
MDLHFSARTTTDSGVGAHRATARIPTTLNENKNSVILSEASEFVARAFCAQQSIQTRVEWTCIPHAGTTTNFPHPERTPNSAERVERIEWTCISPPKSPRTPNERPLPPSFGKPTQNTYAAIMRERSYYVYIIASRTRVLYTGMTGNIEARAVQHKTKYFAGFTADYNCCRLVWYESYDDPNRAIAREKQIKRWIRAKKLALIQKMNPTWIDPSENWGKPLRPISLEDRIDARMHTSPRLSIKTTTLSS